VWLAGEDSNKWHSGYGGGIVGQVMGLPGVAFRATAATTTEGGVRIYFGAGYSF
jgi:hypothetical protein